MAEDQLEAGRVLSQKEFDQEVYFLREHLGLKGNDLVLDLGSGEGLHVKTLRDRGFEAVGVDFVNLPKEPKKGKFVLGDMAKLPFDDESFDAAYVLYGADFPILEYPSHGKSHFISLLKEVRRVLKAGRKFLYHHSGDNDEIIEAIKTDTDSDKEGRELAESLFSLKDFEEMFNEAGMPVKETYGDFKGNPYGKGFGETIFVAQKE